MIKVFYILEWYSYSNRNHPRLPTRNCQ